MCGTSFRTAIAANARRGTLSTLLALAALVTSAEAASEAAATRSVIGPDNQYLSDGSNALRAGDFEEGVRLTLRGLEMDPFGRHKADALSNLCAGYIGLNQLDEALRYCDEAIEANPDHWRAYNNRAAALLRKGDEGGARAAIFRGLAVAPESRTLNRALENLDARKRRPRVIVEDG